MLTRGYRWRLRPLCLLPAAKRVGGEVCGSSCIDAYNSLVPRKSCLIRDPGWR